MTFESLAKPGFPNVTRTAVTRYNPGATANITRRAFAILTILALFGNMDLFRQSDLNVFESAEKTTPRSFSKTDSTFTEEASEQAAKVLSGLEKSGRGIEIRDLFNGATAIQEGFAVATQNKEHFDRIPGLTVLSEKELLRRL